MRWLLMYDLVDNYLERRGPLRDAHLALVRSAHQRGEILMAGALADPADAAILVFSSDSRVTAEDFARNDPYVKAGLVTAWRVRQWNVVVG
ncbi:MAG TPA: YciI-like protein [Acidimicrobiales bacterium]|jgi:hypothetical protein